MYTKILVPVDGSKFAECVLPSLRWFVKVSHVNEIVFLRVVEPFKIPGGILDTAVPESERDHLETDAVKLSIKYLSEIGNEFESGTLKITREVLVGKPAKIVGDYVSSCDVDLIIMATHGHSGIHRWVRGSVADEILHAAHVPVLLVRPEDKEPD